jgi:hypothetical protein
VNGTWVAPDGVRGLAEGSVNESGEVQLTLVAWNRQANDDASAGTLSMPLMDNALTLRGMWTPSGTTNASTVEWRRVADGLALRLRAGLRIGRFGGTKEFHGHFPRLVGSSPLHAKVNDWLHDWCRASAEEFTSAIGSHVVDGVRSPGTVWSWARHWRCELMHVSDSAVSVLIDVYEFSGGAHGNTAFRSLNAIATDAGPRAFTLGDLFRPQSQWQVRLSALCVADLHQQGASSVTSNPSFTLKADSLQAFTVSPAGIAIHFEPYAVGSYAEGAFTVRIPWESMREFLNPDGPARSFTGAKSPAQQHANNSSCGPGGARNDAVESRGPSSPMPALRRATWNICFTWSAKMPSPDIRDPKRGSFSSPPRISRMRFSTFSSRSGKWRASQSSNSAATPNGSRIIT